MSNAKTALLCLIALAATLLSVWWLVELDPAWFAFAALVTGFGLGSISMAIFRVTE